jgi:leader peptidase (prepilin peptidase)/N-methyltransferase
MPSYLLIPLLLIIGFYLGMVVNYLSDVLPAQRKLSKPVCQGCLGSRSWMEFISLQSCPSCGRKVSIRFILVPAAFMGLTVYFYLFPAQRLGTWPILFLLAYFSVVLVNDLEHRVVLFQVSIAGLVICFLYGYFLHGLWATLIGGLVGFAIMYLLYLGGGWFTKFLSKRRGEEVTEIALGFGDVSIGAVIGLLLGWPAITAGLMIGILTGGLISGLFLLGMVLLRRYQPFSALPYTPFLILGAVILLFMKG